MRSILDHMKDYEHILLDSRNPTLNGQVHNQDQDSDNFKLADQVIDVRLVELNMLVTPQ